MGIYEVTRKQADGNIDVPALDGFMRQHYELTHRVVAHAAGGVVVQHEVADVEETTQVYELDNGQKQGSVFPESLAIAN